MRTVLISIAMLALAACGSSPEPKPAADDEGVRPPVHGCSACRIEACYMDATPNRLSRVELTFEPTLDGKPLARRYTGASVELKPATGFAQSLQLDTGKWNDTRHVTAVKDPDIKPAPSGWADTTGTIEAQWKDGDKVHSKKYDNIPVTISKCN